MDKIVCARVFENIKRMVGQGKEIQKFEKGEKENGKGDQGGGEKKKR